MNKTKHPLYHTWQGMIRRCTKPKDDAYKWYGARGVAVCERWLDFWKFVEDMGPKPTPEHSIDRYPDPAGNYEPSNCRWATIIEQRWNTRGEYKPAGQTAFGRTQTIAEWAREFGLNKNTLLSRMYQAGRSLEDALTLEVKMGPRPPSGKPNYKNGPH